MAASINSIQRVTENITNAMGTSGTITISSVTTGQTVLFVTQSLPATGTYSENKYNFQVYLTSSTQLTWTRENASSAPTIQLRIEVVEFDDTVSVQRGQVDSTNPTASATISSVTTAQSWVISRGANHSSGFANQNGHRAVFLNNATTVQCTQWASGTPAQNTRFEVIEFDSSVDVQRGNLAITGTSHDETITAVDTAKSVVYVGWKKNDANAETSVAGAVMDAFLNSTTVLRVTRSNTASGKQLYYQVIEGTNWNVQQGTENLAASDTSDPVTISSVNTNQSWPMTVLQDTQQAPGFGQGDSTMGVTNDDKVDSLARLILQSSTSMDVTRGASTTTANWRWQVVEIEPPAPTGNFPVFEAATEASRGTNDTTLSISYPQPVNAGDDLLLIVFVDADDATGTTCTGFSSRIDEQFNDAGSRSCYMAVFHKIAAGTESGSETITLGSSASDGTHAIMLRYSGSDGSTTPPVDLTPYASNNSSPSAAGTALSADDFKVITFVGISSSNDYSSVPSGYTFRESTPNSGTISLATSDKDQTGNGTTVYGDEAWAIPSSRSIAGFVALKGVAGALSITAGAPVASQASVGTHSIASEQPITVGAPVASQASVGTHSIGTEQLLTAGAPAASQSSVGTHDIGIEQLLTATAPIGSQSSVGTHTVSLTIAATAPIASQSSVGVHTVSGIQLLTATAPVASQSSVGTHTVGTEQLITAGAPIASQSSVGTHTLSQEITATAPVASQASVGTHTIGTEQLITVGAPVASQESVGTHSIASEQLITVGAPVASQASVGTHTVSFPSQQITAGAPVASQASVGTHSIASELGLTATAPASSLASVGTHSIASEQLIVAGPPAQAASSVGDHSLQLQIVATAPEASQSSVGTHALGQNLTATAPVASLASVGDVAGLDMNLTATVPEASQSSVGSHAVTLPGSLAATPPVASLASVGTHSIAGEQTLTAGAPASSQASVGTHSIASELPLAPGAPVASQSSVGTHSIASELIITAGAPVASQSAVGTHSIGFGVQTITAGAPVASQASVGTHALLQNITATAPVASQASVGVHVLEQSLVAAAPAASQSAVGAHTVTLNIQVIQPGPPIASQSSVGTHLLLREGLPDAFAVTLSPAISVSGTIEQAIVVSSTLSEAIGLAVTVNPISGMNTIYHTGEVIKVLGVFTEDDVPTTASGTVSLYIERPGTDQVDVVTPIAEGITGNYSVEYTLTGPGTYHWRMASSDGRGIEEGSFNVVKSNILGLNLFTTPPIATQSSVQSHTIAI